MTDGPGNDNRIPRGSARLVVLGDSLAGFTEAGVFRPGDPGNYPEQLGRRLAAATSRDWTVDLLAQTWMSVWVASTEVAERSDVRSRLRDADVVVVGLSTGDVLPVFPPTRRLLRGASTMGHRPPLRRVRPHWVRPLLWGTFAKFHHVMVDATHSRYPHTPRAEFGPAWRRLVNEIRRAAPQAVLVAMTPTVGRQGTLEWPSPHREAAVADILELAAEMGVPVVELAEVVAPFLDSLPDGTHWHGPAHAAVADALAEVVVIRMLERNR
ncbi:MAG TPA: SGNH/GDSL hydrolase family protein [Acidimicrobiales bacterium]|nr:SGNH/GDSL hydrolase family protein [Acidimicrobiales bacterium]